MSRNRKPNAKPTAAISLLYAFGCLLIAAELFTSFLFIFALKRLNILQPWQFFIVIFILALILLVNSYILFFRIKAKVFGKTCACIGALLLSIICLVGYGYIQKTNDFISDITGEHTEEQVYNLRILKKSGITTVDQLAGKKIGFINTDPNLDRIKSELKETLPEYEIVEYETLGDLIVAIYANEISAYVINDIYFEYIEDSEYTLEDDSTVISTVRFEVEGGSNLRAPVDVISEPFIVYLSGSDSRQPGYVASRSDVNILAVVNPSKGKILLVNIPRDYQVQLHGTTGLKDKLTHAGLYGIEMSKTTIEDLLDIKINYTVRIGFQGVQKLVDAIGGIDIESPIAMKLTVGDQSSATYDNRKWCSYKKGMNHLDGTCTLRYARERKSFANGDLDRGKHQQQVLTAIINKIAKLNYVTHYTDILEAAKGTFQTSFTETEITDFVRWQLSELKSWQIESIQIGNSNHILTPTYTIRNENLWVYLPDEESENAAKARIAEYLLN